jgi:tetratricopeptide (TPR) repeat protein
LTFWLSGDLRGAADTLRGAIALDDASVGQRSGLAGLPAVLVRFLLATVLGELGEFSQALSAGEEGLRIAENAGHSYSEVWARFGLGYACLRYGNVAQAIRVLESGLSLCRKMEIRVALPFIAASLSSAYVWSGRAAPAVPLLEEAIEVSTAIRLLGLRSLFITFLADAYLVLRRVSEAREHARQAVELARAHQQQGWEAWALKVLADAHAHVPGEVDQAEDAYQQASALAAQLGMRPLLAHCYFGLGKLHAKTGQRETGREHLAAATALYREMDMRLWLDQAEVETGAIA